MSSKQIILNRLHKKQLCLVKLINEINDLKDSINLDKDYYEVKKRSKVFGFTSKIEDFIDEDTGDVVSLKRSMLCRINGKPCDEKGKLLVYFQNYNQIQIIKK